MASEFRLIQTVALFAAVALFVPAWAEPDDGAFLKKYGNQSPVQTGVPVASMIEPELNDPDYFTRKYGNYKPREPESSRYREVPLGPGPHVLIIDMPELGTIKNGQAASLVGVAPIPKESGTYKGQSRIGGGRAHVREALFMPALVACRDNPDLKAKYEALIKLGKPAKKAIIAVLRKLIVLANALLSKRKLWTPNPA